MIESTTRTLGAIWRWSVLVTLPLAILGMVWLPSVWRDTKQFLVWHPASMHRSSDVDLNLRQILRARLVALRTDVFSAWKARWAPRSETLPTVELTISPTNLARLNANLPRSGKQDFVRGMMRYPNGNFEKVGLRYRGDSLHHWGFAAKSWLVRTSAERLIEGRRRLHVVLPRWRSVGNYHANLRIAEQMGILAVESRLTNLTVNGRQHGGIYLLQPQQDEAFLRNHRRLPSDLYVGDMTPLDDNFVNEVPFGGLWELPWLWQKAAANNKFEEESRRPLEILFFRTHHGSDEELLELLDLPAWARFSAYMQVMAAGHMDMGHNWKLLFDAGKLTFEPVVGDGNGLPDDVLEQTAGLPARDVSITTPLLARLHRNHQFLRLKQAAIADFFHRELDRSYFVELDAIAETIGPTLRVFPQLDWHGTVDGHDLFYFGDRALRQRLAAVRPQLERWFDEQRAANTARPENVRACAVDARTVRLQIEGHAAAKIGLRLPGTAPLKSAILRIWREGGMAEQVEVTSLLHANDGLVWLEWPLLGQREIETPAPTHSRSDHRVRAASYDLLLDEIDARNVEVHVATNGGGHFPVPLQTEFGKTLIAPSNTSLLPQPREVLHWENEVVINGIMDIRRDLDIAPGTRVRLAPGAALILRGKISARGSSAYPVSFERQDPATPWGILAVVGRGCDSSFFEHCRFFGGSGLVTPFTVFSGMVSVRDVHSIRFDACEFGDNSGYDDLFHAAYSELQIKDSVFQHAWRDGIDLDLCTASIDNTAVDGTGNDGLDVMTSNVVVTRSRLLHGTDKGLSAGEAAKVVVIDTVIADNQIGVQAKDATEILLYNVTLRRNATALSGYHKNRSYSGTARLRLARSVIDQNGHAIDLRDHSELQVWDSQTPSLIGTNVHVTVTAGAGQAHSDRQAAPPPPFGELIPGEHWRNADQTRLGATEHPILTLPR